LALLEDDSPAAWSLARKQFRIIHSPWRGPENGIVSRRGWITWSTLRKVKPVYSPRSRRSTLCPKRPDDRPHTDGRSLVKFAASS
jgi:hypothetical protein